MERTTRWKEKLKDKRNGVVVVVVVFVGLPLVKEDLVVVVVVCSGLRENVCWKISLLYLSQDFPLEAVPMTVT